MSFNESRGCTVCIVSHGVDDPRITAVKRRLVNSFTGSINARAASANASDPFLLQTMICYECFMQSDNTVFELGGLLYSALDAVDTVADAKYNRSELEFVTFKLHQVSQDADSLLQSADIAISIMDSMLVAQKSLAQSSTVRPQHRLQCSINASECLKRLSRRGHAGS